LEALSVKINEALRLPVAEGAKVTLSVQVPFGVTVAPVQASAFVAKSLAFVPPTVTVERVRLAVPVLVTVTVWAALVPPTFCAPKVRLVGEQLTKGAVPLAEIFATNALPYDSEWRVACNGLTVGKLVDQVCPDM
jgi:hypothetical protein